MKKYSKLIVAAAVLLCGLVLTGCGVKDYVEQTYDTWYQYEYDGSAIKIPLGASDGENVQELHTLEGVEFYVRYNPDDGLEVAIQADKEQNVEVFSGLVNAPAKVTMGGTHKFNTNEFGTTLWAALVLLPTGLDESSTPKIVAKPDECIKLDDYDNFKIQWKKVLATYLVNFLSNSIS